MALKLRRDTKKSSYYVWFLGAKESRGVRGVEHIVPIVKHLEMRERDVEPFKVTLQVSYKGLKIIQNIGTGNQQQQQIPGSNNTTFQGGHHQLTQPKSRPKSETIKHFIPHNTITSVYQQEDIIACILVLFNPVTKCPLHVHAYRCDSLETAAHLKQQLLTLIDRPDNQKKIIELEARLCAVYQAAAAAAAAAAAPTAPLPAPPPITAKKRIDSSSIGSSNETLSTRGSLSSTEDRDQRGVAVNSGGGAAITVPSGGGGGGRPLFDSVAAELRNKFNRNQVPILLPPRDYDTVHRQKGNLQGIDLRRCLNVNIVGRNVDGGGGGGGRTATTTPTGRQRLVDVSSGGSSGIGSDHPPSPESPDTNESTMRFNGTATGDNHSTSDEDWNGDPGESTIYMMHDSHMALPHHSQSESIESVDRNNHCSQQQQQQYFPMKSTHSGGSRGKHALNGHNNSTERTRNNSAAGRQPENPTVNAAVSRRSETSQKENIKKKDLHQNSISHQEQSSRSRFGHVVSHASGGRNNRKQPSHQVREYMGQSRDNLYCDDGYQESYRRHGGVCHASNHQVIRERTINNINVGRRHQSPSATTNQAQEFVKLDTPRSRFYDAKQKFLSMEKLAAVEQQQHQFRQPPTPPSSATKPTLRRHESMAVGLLEGRTSSKCPATSMVLGERGVTNHKQEKCQRSMHDLLLLADERQSEPFSSQRSTNNTNGQVRLRQQQNGIAGYRHSYAEPRKFRTDYGFPLNCRQNGGSGQHSYESQPQPRAMQMPAIMLQRTKSVLNTNNGRVGIASVKPY